MENSETTTVMIANPLPSLALLSDEEVVERVLAGEIELFEILMRRYNQRLYRVARAILANDGEAEDVMQDAYVRAYTHLGNFDGRSAFYTWGRFDAGKRHRPGRRSVSGGRPVRRPRPVFYMAHPDRRLRGPGTCPPRAPAGPDRRPFPAEGRLHAPVLPVLPVLG